MRIIRSIEPTDAAAFLRLCRQLDGETPWMLLEPDERQTSVDAVRMHITNVVANDNQTILVAADDTHLVGYIEATGGAFRRNRHSAYIVIGVLETFTGQGIGTQLFAALEQWAQTRHLHRLELTVQVQNARAVHLYQKLGFRIEGVKKHALVVGNSYVDEYYMATLLGE